MALNAEGEDKEGGAPVQGAEQTEQRPVWLPSWVPEWVWRRHHPLVQLAIMLACYAVHLLVLSKNSWNFPYQVAPAARTRARTIPPRSPPDRS